MRRKGDDNYISPSFIYTFKYSVSFNHICRWSQLPMVTTVGFHICRCSQLSVVTTVGGHNSWSVAAISSVSVSLVEYSTGNIQIFKHSFNL